MGGGPDEFHRRLRQVCDDSAMIPPYGHGRQVHIAAKLKVSQEAVRKWFTGDARPRASKMGELAKLLEVDEAWLSLGIAPEMDRKQKRMHHEKTDGAVYLLFGMFNLAGGHCAFPGERDLRKDFVDFYTIIHGSQMALHVCAGREVTKDSFEFTLPREYNEVRCLGVVGHPNLKFHIIDLDQRLIEQHKVRKGGGYSLTLGYHDGDYMRGRDKWPRIRHLGDL
jgi:transcriptional regulator with XRE-family HTH domain